MEEFNFGNYMRGLRKSLRLSAREVAEQSGVSNAYIIQIEKGDRRPPKPEILKKLAPVYKVTIRELFLKAGYFNEPEVTATEEQRIDVAFQYVMADPDYKLGTRIRGESLSVEAKRGIIIVYETLTGKKLLSV